MEDEPLFNYARCAISITTPFSCATAHPRLLALGTTSGDIFLLDPATGVERRRFPSHHRGPVLSLSVDDDCEWLASCSSDVIRVCPLGPTEEPPFSLPAAGAGRS